MNHEELRDTYRAVFDCPVGATVLDDLYRVANHTRIDSDHPDPHAAVYKAAQLALLRRVEKMLEDN